MSGFQPPPPVKKIPVLFGNPYVGWSPRPTKNGQPPFCGSGSCSTGIGYRKVGGFARRIPQIWSNPKVKEQIVQKWDPVSKRLVNVKCPCADGSVGYVPPTPPPSGPAFQFIVVDFSQRGNVAGSITFSGSIGGTPLWFTQTDKNGVAVNQPPLANVYVYSQGGNLLASFPTASVTSLPTYSSGYQYDLWLIYANESQPTPSWNIGDTVIVRYTPI